MTTPFSGRKAEFGIAKQAAEGTPATDPTFNLPFFDIGELLKQEAGEVEFARANLDPEAESKQMVMIDGQVTVPVYSAATGLLLLNCLGSDTVTGVGPYTHTFKFADVPPFSTIFWRTGAQYFKGTDCLIDTLEFEFEAGQPLKANATFKGKSGERLASAYADANNPSDLATFWKYTGAVMNLDFATTPATTRTRVIKDGKVRFSREIDLIQTDSVTPQIVHPKRSICEVEATWVMEAADWDLVRATFFGGVGNNTPSDTLVNGSFDFQFVRGSHTLNLKSGKVSLRVGQPTPAQGGEAVEMQIVGRALRDGTSTPAAVLVNDTASY